MNTRFFMSWHIDCVGAGVEACSFVMPFSARSNTWSRHLLCIGDDIRSVRYFGYLPISDKAIIDNDSLRSFLTFAFRFILVGQVRCSSNCPRSTQPAANVWKASFPLPGNELHAFRFFAVIQQQTVSLIAITASFAHKGVDFCPLLRCDFEHRTFLLFLVNLITVFVPRSSYCGGS